MQCIICLYLFSPYPPTSPEAVGSCFSTPTVYEVKKGEEEVEEEEPGRGGTGGSVFIVIIF